MFSSPKKGAKPAENVAKNDTNNNNDLDNNNIPNETEKDDKQLFLRAKSIRFSGKAMGPVPSRPFTLEWRMKERMKTVSVALVLCLNVGVDPPDITKTEPCARLECWIDPLSALPQKALDAVGKQLQVQYERWQPRARYKLLLDATIDEVRKLCTSLRRSSKDERILFHYNGHGVPRATGVGEIWVFNKSYTQYIPLSIYDLQGWMGSPSIYVFDCSGAGTIVQWFQQFVEQREKQAQETRNPDLILKDYILLAACSANEILPMNPTLPADIFTSCLTTPIKMALKWFCLTEPLSEGVVQYIDKIPGSLTDRRTPLGELNWIFTAITDTIAWNELPLDLFHKLFRQDLLVASLFRNYLLAERILYSLNCTPMTVPKMPAPTYQHHMWQAWDLAVDNCLSQMPNLLKDNSEYIFSTFFTDQLTAFEVWLQFASENKKPPEQLPIVLQVLLSQVHRIRALDLLAKFLDLGPWAVNLALSVGIFPYVLKLLQSPAQDLRQVLVFIWTKTLALDQSCQSDLVKDQSHTYFLNIFSNPTSHLDLKIQSAFILSVICSKFNPGQAVCLTASLITTCLANLSHRNSNLRKWSILCLSKLWENFEDAKVSAIRESAHERLCTLLTDPIPEVRAATIYALSTLLGGASGIEDRVRIELNLSITLLVVTEDASPMVRCEFIVALAKLLQLYKRDFIEIVATVGKGKNNQLQAALPPENPLSQRSSVFLCLWRVILSMRHDPFPEVAQYAEQIVSFVQNQLSSQNIDLSKSFDRSNNNNNSGSSKNSSGSGPHMIGSVDRSKPKSSAFPSLGFGSRTPRSQEKTSPQGTPSGASTPAHEGTSSQLKKDAVLDFSTLALDDDEDEDPLLIESDFYAKACAHWSRPTHTYDQSLSDHTSHPLPTSSSSSSSINSTNNNNNHEPKQNENLHNQFIDEESTWGERLWREQRFEESISAVKRSRAISAEQPNLKWDEQAAILNNGSNVPAHVLFHPFEPTLVVANHPPAGPHTKGTSSGSGSVTPTVSVWDRQAERLLHDFPNCAATDSLPSLGNTTSISLLNVHNRSLLLTANDHAVVRIFEHYDDPEKRRLLTSWKAFVGGLVSGGKGAGLVVHNLAVRGWLATSGDINVVRVWDLERELHLQDIPTGSNSSVTSITSNSMGNLITLGCADGSVRLFDCRIATKFGHVTNFVEHHDWLVNVQMPKSSDNQIWSASASGEIKLWDISKSMSVKTIQSVEYLTAFAVHDYASVFAVGSQKQKIKVFNFAGDDTLIRYHEGFLGQRIGPVTCLKFHPYLDLLAAGAADGLISIYTKRVH